MMMDRRDHFIQNTRIKSLFRNDGTKFFFIHQISIMLLGCVGTFNNLSCKLRALCWTEGVSLEFLDSETAASGIVLCSTYHCYFHIKRNNNFYDNFKLFWDKLHQFFVYFIMVSCACLLNKAWKRRRIFMKNGTPWWFCACGIVCNSHIILRLILCMALWKKQNKRMYNFRPATCHINTEGE